MKRYVDLKDISDGRLYTAKDMVKADCMGCSGCSKCCSGMGDSILLDPYDVYRWKKGLGKDLEIFLAEGTVELGVVDGVILPHLKMLGARQSCGFLSEQGRCTIHDFRPGFCRLFPLGRYYENGSFRYFLQKDECTKPKIKIKIEKWLDTEDLPAYEAFVGEWHDLLLLVEKQTLGKDEVIQKAWNMALLKCFFLAPYDANMAFYDQLKDRKRLFKENVPR